MRVIAGTYRSRQLAAPRGLDTRPTSDRLRETLFSILSPRLEGCRFVDLYAGTGAVGIEALSRGAAHVWFAENADPALASLRTNLAALKISSGYTIEPRGVGAVLQKLGKLTQQIDLIFLDPPYEAEAEYAGTLSFLGSARGREMLAPDALVIAEHTKKAKLAARYGGLEHTRLVKQGDASLSFFAFAEEKTPHPDAAL
ncbi:MAG TPA: 16S rRNA (guanine(966)-N(2))-methyltransferase RsmD [Edaphobacter sp.]|uniref:16S rRNA (guanine(966)-N(2))-methyltransferase RsmD n=1 Tax=Edaphobacter sp. TaxID=1934404 RepID=UPI002BCCDC88|nr:16S rRNA (guanine(966)-N(2))-methyltransferase RsmD [Edaphobacter sp.]HUZ93303.1 16S rRNA (guanine(966)-N(2))-methyltransferase RsmD [Edaphobacter sp.]